MTLRQELWKARFAELEAWRVYDNAFYDNGETSIKTLAARIVWLNAKISRARVQAARQDEIEENEP